MSTINTVSYSNRKSSNQGKVFEKLIQAACDYYRRKGYAEVEKTPEPFMVTKLLGGNTFTGKFIGKAQPDFQGTIAGGGSIIFEAKTTSKDRIRQSVITKAQSGYLNSHHELGATVGVCVHIGRTYAFVPWPVWINMKEKFGRKYILEMEIKKYEVSTPGMILFLDNVVDQMKKEVNPIE